MIKTLLYFMLVATLLMLSTTDAGANLPPNPIAPPARVKCGDAAHCEVNPVKLEAFVVRFFEWYIYTNDLMDLPLDDNPYYVKRAKDATKEQNTELKKFLTPQFFYWRNKSYQETEEGEIRINYDPRYCIKDGNDPIICAQDWNDNWMTDTTAMLISMDKNGAFVLVRFPILPGEGEKEMPYLLVAYLKPIAGKWRVDGVIRLSAY